VKIEITKPPYCPDCGGDSIPHRQHYWTILVGVLGRPFFLFAQKMGGYFFKNAYLTDASTRGWYDRLAAWGMGQYHDAPDDKTLLFGHILWQEAAAHGVTMREFRILGVPTSSFIAYLPSSKRLSFESFPLYPSERPVWWIDDKAISKKRLAASGIPVARGGSAFSFSRAQKLFRDIGGAAVVKPREGSASRHTTLHVTDEQKLREAFRVAKQVCPFVMIEEELPGSVYRPTLVNGTLIATLRRDQPQVTGDGIKTVRELVSEANKHPARGGPYFSPIKLDDAAAAELSLHGFNFDSVPHKGAVVRLNSKINWALGGTTTDVTDEVHLDNKELFERIAQILEAPVVGIDFIMEDIAKSWKEQPCGVIECNGRPFFDNHHLPFQGKPRNVAGYMWSLLQNNI
jgi:D-alanine-D-alanine ligase-like ATP-grasp enzyme